MRRPGRWLIAAVVAAILVISVVPETWLWASRSTESVLVAVLSEAIQSIPEPLIIGVGMLLLLALSFFIIFGVVRLFTNVGTATGERLAGWYDRITPDSPQTKALAFMVAFVIVFIGGIGAFAPWLATSLAEDSGVDDVISDIRDGRYGGNVEELFSEDAVTPGSDPVQPDVAGEDSDGDGLPDEWERAGQTPGGARLPGANPNQLDLYVQLNYGANVTALSDNELRRLEAVWSQMPVQRGEGPQGIDLHIVEEREEAGELGEEVVINSMDAADRFYTEPLLGDRHCVYRQVVLGQDRSRDNIGYAEAPGYAAVYDGSRFGSYNGGVPFRVAMLTHGLLHTVVGDVDGTVHTEGGWMDYPDRENEELTDAVAEQLSTRGFVTTEAYQQRCGPVWNETAG